MKRSFIVSIFLFYQLLLVDVSFADEPRWTTPRFGELPLAFDGGHIIEGTGTAPAWAWHAKLQGRWAYDIGLGDKAHQTNVDLGFGLGLPFDLGLGLAFPIGWTAGSKQKINANETVRPLDGMGKGGFAVGDIRIAAMWSFASAAEGGLGLLVGFCGLVPTGDNEALMGEGGFTAEPFVSMAVQVFSTRLTLNLAYRIRPEHIAPERGQYFEQDDELVWRTGLRIPRENDVAWSIEAEGTIGTTIGEGGWPSSDSRPVWIGGGIDFPVSRRNRIGFVMGLGLVGEAVPDFSFAMRFTLAPVLPDEDKDGVGGLADDCPLLPEDRDGFEDSDGCPEYDNDMDGFPDDEDQCPLKPAQDYSDNGC